jgi:hypothetical protein
MPTLACVFWLPVFATVDMTRSPQRSGLVIRDTVVACDPPAVHTPVVIRHILPTT